MQEEVLVQKIGIIDIIVLFCNKTSYCKKNVLGHSAARCGWTVMSLTNSASLISFFFAIRGLIAEKTPLIS